MTGQRAPNPVGRWRTVNSRRVSLAKTCSSLEVLIFIQDYHSCQKTWRTISPKNIGDQAKRRKMKTNIISFDAEYPWNALISMVSLRLSDIFGTYVLICRNTYPETLKAIQLASRFFILQGFSILIVSLNISEVHHKKKNLIFICF